MNIEDYSKMNVQQLQQILKEKGYKGGVSKMNKNQLIDRITSTNTDEESKTSITNEDRRERMMNFISDVKEMKSNIEEALKIIKEMKSQNIDNTIKEKLALLESLLD